MRRFDVHTTIYMVMKSCAHYSLNSNCESFELKALHPPPHKSTVWHSMQTSADHIKRAIDLFNWQAILNNHFQ